MAFDEHFIDQVNGLPAGPGGRPGRSGDLNFGLGMVSRLARQRAIRLAWRGRSSSADLRIWSLRVRGTALTRPSEGGGSGYGPGWPQVVHPGMLVEEKDTGRILRVFYAGLAQLREILARIEELERET